MRVKEMANRTKSEIRRMRNSTRRSWSTEERALRRRLAEAKQQRLFNMMMAQPAASARVA